MAGDGNVDAVALDGAAGVLCDEEAIAIDVNTAAKRDDTGIDRDGAALGQRGAELGRRVGAAVAGGTRAIERQAIVAKFLEVVLDDRVSGQGAAAADRARRNRAGFERIEAGLCSGLSCCGACMSSVALAESTTVSVDADRYP